MQDVAINGRLLQPPIATLVVRGRVLVPARAVFHGLGATVDFDPGSGRIAVRRGLHFLQVTIGSRQGFVDNRPVTLDVAPLTHDGIIYMPMRFVAESLGGHVGHVPGMVDIEDSQAPGSSPARLFRRAFGAAKNGGQPPSIVYRRPLPGEFVTGGFPTISAIFRTHGGPGANVSTIRVFFDGADVSRSLVTANDAVAYTPSSPLEPGTHHVLVRALDTAGHAFFSSWSFGSVPIPQGAPPGVVGFAKPAFAALDSGVSAPGGSLRFTLTTTSAGAGYVTLCGYSTQYPFARGNDAYHYYVSITPAVGFFAPACQAVAFFTDINGYQNAYPLSVPLAIDTRPRTKP